MRSLLVLLLAVTCHAESWSLYACMATTKNYVVGAKLLPSGVFRRSPTGNWIQIGHPNPFAFALDYDRRDPSRLFLAAGNGIIQLAPNSRSWRILTGSDVTEMRDVAVAKDGSIYYAYVAGIRVSRDGGATWKELGESFAHRYTEVLRIDGERQNVLLAGKEDGVYRSEDDGARWKLAGAAGFSVLDIEQSPHDPCFWLAATELGGLFASRDCGRSFENTGKLGVGTNLYDIAFDPAKQGRIAVAGWGNGVSLSEDNGTTWTARNATLPSTEVWSVAFDPAHPGHLFAGVHERAVYMSVNAGESWTPAALDGTVVYRLRFIPDSK